MAFPGGGPLPGPGNTWNSLPPPNIQLRPTHGQGQGHAHDQGQSQSLQHSSYPNTQQYQYNNRVEYNPLSQSQQNHNHNQNQSRSFDASQYRQNGPLQNGYHQHQSQPERPYIPQTLPPQPQIRHQHHFQNQSRPSQTQASQSSQPTPVPASHAPPTPIHNPQPSPAQDPQAPSPQFINPSQLFQLPPQSYAAPQAYTGIGQDTLSRYQMAPTRPPGPMSIDRPMLMTALAEEYFDAAHKIVPSVSASLSAKALGEYHKLIAAGLGLLDTALKRVKMAPRVEANMRLRYAGVLHEETENSMEAESAVSKGITLCDRNHYFDLKYAMQFLLAQIMFKKSHKAGLKALDANITDAEAYQHIPWVYAFRFLRASNSLASGLPTDKWKENFESITALAQQQNDRGIWLASCLMEALSYLRSNGPDAMESAQGAIASAWSYQTEEACQIPPLIALAHMIDVSCSIRQGSPAVMVTKLKQLQRMMDVALKDNESWAHNSENIAIPISRSAHSSQVVSSDTRTVLGIGRDGRDNLMLSFLSKRDAYSITYLLGGLVLLHKNSHDGRAVRMFEAGLEQLEGMGQKDSTPSGLLPNCIIRLHWQDQLVCYYTSCLAFCSASICDWLAVKKHIEKLESAMHRLDSSLIGPLSSIALYLSGIYHQGIGDLEEALEIFGDEKFDMSLVETSTSSPSQVERDYALLAALNVIWIIQEPHYQDDRRNNAMIERISKACQAHPSVDMQAAFHLVAATVQRSPPMSSMEVRSHLSQALKAATSASNMQFISITLSVMCNRFFVSVVGEQAEKSALAASTQAHRSGNNLWMSVADGMLAQCLELNSKPIESAKTLETARQKAQAAFPGY